MCQPRGARRLATSVPSPLPILAQGTGACQLGCDHTVSDHNLGSVVNRKRQGTLDRVCNRQGVPHMGVNRSHENPGTDCPFVSLLIHERINVPRLLCVTDKLLHVDSVTVTANQLGRLGTLGTDQATEDDHFFSLVCCGLTAGMIIQEKPSWGQ